MYLVDPFELETEPQTHWPRITVLTDRFSRVSQSPYSLPQNMKSSSEDMDEAKSAVFPTLALYKHPEACVSGDTDS